jgi:hypothetical protein
MVILTSVVRINAMHLWTSFFFLLPPQLTPGTVDSTLRHVSRVKSSTPGGIEISTFRLTRHTPALGSSGGRHRIPEGSKGQEILYPDLFFSQSCSAIVRPKLRPLTASVQVGMPDEGFPRVVQQK